MNKVTPREMSQMGKSMSTDFDEVRALAEQIIQVGVKKNAEYGESWSKSGGQGAWFQGVSRKISRIETQIENMDYNLFDVSVDPSVTESIDETLKDLVMYSLLTLVRRQKIVDEIKNQEYLNRPKALVSEPNQTPKSVNSIRFTDDTDDEEN